MLATLALASLSLFALITLLAVRAGGTPAFHGTPYPEPEPAPNFTLLAHPEGEVSLSDFRGRAVLLFFGFTRCPDVCPMTLQRLRSVTEGLGRRGENVHILLVTVDPERDSPEALDEYVRQFGPNVTGLTGDPDELEALRRTYGVYAAMQAHHPERDPMIMHTDAVFGIDRQGRLRVLLDASGSEDELRADIRTLLGS
jgi:protein SCO1